MEKGETLQVRIASVFDAALNSVGANGHSFDPNFNQELTKPWPEDEELNKKMQSLLTLNSASAIIAK